MSFQKTILVAPLHWGLGHATRCIPIINALLQYDFKVLIASDGGALELLRKEFPTVETLELPSYNITYPEKGSHFKWRMFLKLPHIKKTMSSEKKIVAQLISENRIHGIISDNRFGVYSKKIPCVFITHQLNVLSGITSALSSKLHQQIIKKFDECWVPDFSGEKNLSGDLGHLKNHKLPIKHIGPLSRMTAKKLPIKYDVLALLSGPEPQRTLLEKRILLTLSGSVKKVLLVQGKVEKEQKTTTHKSISIVNFLLSKDLETAINQSDLVLSRSGYTTIMDLAALGKKAFFIPTPGQYEQEYLAKRLKKQKIVSSCKQEKFSEKKLKKVKKYSGLGGFNNTQDFKVLFGLFQSERKLRTNA